MVSSAFAGYSQEKPQTTNAQVTETQKPKKIYIIEGYFFHEIPMDKHQLNGMLSLETANGTRAMGLMMKTPLSDDAKKYAVPVDQVLEGDILLEMFNERRNQMIGFSTSDKVILKVGERFPEFKATDIEGREWTNADVKDKVMVLNCWYTGCGPCRAEMPELSRWKDEMPDVMFFSATYERPSTALPVLEKTGFNWIPLVNDKQFKDYVGPKGYPLTVVVDKTGKIVQVENGTSPLQREKLLTTIRSLRE